jgi:phospholipase C
MTTADRREFLQLLAGSAAASALPASIARALAIPAHNLHGTIDDVEHIVILMQENRSFDHYFGTLNGVRGFGDPRAAVLATGNPVYYQPSGASYVLPFHPPAPDMGLQFLEDLPHDWTSTHVAWNWGSYDQWVPAKGPVTMAYLVREDIPFHYALADAFTICDAFHCSMLGPTDPNRMHLWTGWVGNNGTGGGPALDNSGTEYSWQTFPEQLQAAGVSWKVYQDIGFGLNAAGHYGWAITNPLIGNYGDNPLVYFQQYQTAPPGSPLNVGAMTGTNVAVSGTLWDELIADVQAGTLPQVSWIAAPEAYSEHPNWPANYGAYYISQVIDALTANPAVWSKTVLLICYDENDGFFDHIVPPTPPANASQGVSTVDASLELFPGSSTYPAGPFGLGPRVPLLVVSPWSKGGYVNSQVFDHTSVIRFIAARFGNGGNLNDTNISPWRQSVAGDLTSAFNFKTPNKKKVKLPSTAGYVPPNGNRQPDYKPTPPANQALPAQEPGQRPARALPYQFNVNAARLGSGGLQMSFANAGSSGAVLQARVAGGALPPRSYTIGAGATASDFWNVGAAGQAAYDISVHGPNGFLRQFKGGLPPGVSANLLVISRYDANARSLTVLIVNSDIVTFQISAVNNYTGQHISQPLAPGGTMRTDWLLTASSGWYDVVISVDADPHFAWRLSGHLENGKDSVTDPGIGAA